MIGGSPCQGFSFAGKQLNFNDPRSKLFFEYVNTLNKIKPKYFLLENVKMKKEYQDEISNILGVQPIKINSSLVSAQNRVRLYWTNIPGIKAPEDKNIKLNDILEDGYCDRDKSFCIDANYFKKGNLKSYFEKHRRQIVLQSGRMIGRYIENGVRRDGKGKPIQRIEIRCDKKTNCLTTVRKDNLICYIPINTDEQKYYGLNDDIMYRYLTPVECERLQTLPEGYTNYISDTQRYKCLGNGWTVDVIAHMLGHINENTYQTNKSSYAVI